MAYRVEIARNAEAELEELYLWVMARRLNKARNGSTVLSVRVFPSINTRSAVPSRLKASIRISQFGY
jgi:hypothetical protein